MDVISNARTVPVTEDLTKSDQDLEILRGLDSMFRVDKPLAVGAVFAPGDWAVLGDEGTVSRATGTTSFGYLVWSATNKFDSHITNQVTLIMNSKVVAKTRVFNTDSYSAGNLLTVKNWGAGVSCVGKATGTDPVVARVQEVGDGYLIIEVL